MVYCWRRRFSDDYPGVSYHNTGNIAVKIAIMNNGYLGMVRQWQELFYGRRYVDTKLWNPDFIKIAEAYDISGVRVKHREEVIPAIQKAMESPGAFLIDFLIEPEENIYPIVPPGESLARFFEPSRTELWGEKF